MASKSLTFDIYGKDKSASKTINAVGDSATKAGKKFAGFNKAAGIALAAVAAATVKIGIDSVKAYADAEEQQNKLAFAFKKFPALADTNQKSLQKLNTELQKKTRFDDDDIAGAQASLAQYKLTGKQIETLTPLMLDYAQKTGKDLPTAATDLGKAILGQGKALKGIGIQFHDTGSEAGNLQELVDGLGSKVGGFAEQSGKTAQGKLDRMRNQISDIEEKIGQVVTEIGGPLLDKITTKAIPDLADFVNEQDPNKQQAAIDQFMATLGEKLAYGWGQITTYFTNEWNNGNQVMGEKLALGWQQISDGFNSWIADGTAQWGSHLQIGLQQIGTYFSSGSADWVAKLQLGGQQIGAFFGGLLNSFNTWSINLGSQALKIGQNIVQGITNGIVAGASTVLSSIVNMATNALNAAKNILGIHSPSKEFEWIGKMVGAGMVLGIDGSVEGVQKSMASMTAVPSVASIGVSADGSTAGVSASGSTNNFYMTPIRDNDPHTTARILGEQFGRALAG